MPEHQFRTIQFLVPRAVDLALDRAALRAKGLRFESSIKSAPPAQTRITMQRDYAPLFLVALSELAAKGTLVKECAVAEQALNAALQV